MYCWALQGLMLLAAAGGEGSPDSTRDPIREWVRGPSDHRRLPLSDGTEAALPRGLLLQESKPQEAPAQDQAGGRGRDGGGFEIGPAGGYLNTRGADKGTWFGGVQARLYLARFLAIEGSVTVHQDKFNDGDVRVTQWPVQVSALLFPFPNWPVRPYALGGVGWYYTTTSVHGASSSFGDETDHSFGGHLGAGVELAPSRSLSLFADLRYIFIEPTVDSVEKGDFNYWQILFGIGFGF